MNVTGVVRVDLSGFVTDQVLFVGDQEVHTIWKQLSAGPPRVELDIGDASSVRWDPRLVEMLTTTMRVTVVGTDARGVALATGALRGACAA